MLLNLVEYHWAEHIDDALLLLGRLDTKTVPLAGGTYLLGLHDESIQAVVDLRDLGLAYIAEEEKALRIGAMTTLQSITEAPVLQEFAGGIVARAARASSSSRLIRNSATLGGTIGAGAAAQADLLTALVALNAEVRVRSGSKTQVNLSAGTMERPGLALAGVVYRGKQERRISLATFALDRRPSELIVEVSIPRPGMHCGAAMARIARTLGDVALLNAAAVVEIEDGVFTRVKLALGGANMEAVRLDSVERQLIGQSSKLALEGERLLAVVQASMPEFRPPNDMRVSSGYRRVSGMQLAYRVLEEATNVSHWRSLVVSGKGL